MSRIFFITFLSSKDLCCVTYRNQTLVIKNIYDFYKVITLFLYIICIFLLLFLLLIVYYIINTIQVKNIVQVNIVHSHNTRLSIFSTRSIQIDRYLATPIPTIFSDIKVTLIKNPQIKQNARYISSKILNNNNNKIVNLLIED